jgi:hypothetical protein
VQQHTTACLATLGPASLCDRDLVLRCIQWNDHSEDESMWEHEEFLRSNYPEFLPSRKLPKACSLSCIHFNLDARFLFKGGCNTPCYG